MSKWSEIIDGDNGKISSIKLCTYVVILTLCYALLDAKSSDRASLATIAGLLALGQLGIQRTADVKMAAVNNPQAAPPVTNLNITNSEETIVKP